MMAGTAAAAIGLGDASRPILLAQAREPSIDHTIRIAPASLELAPGKIVKTTGFNGTVPGPVLRLRKGKPVAINVINDAGYPDLIHWHGLFLPSIQDGAMEEGSPIIAPGQSLLYTFMVLLLLAMGRLVLAALAIQKNTREVADHFKWLGERQEAQSQAAKQRAGTTKS